MKKRKTIKIGNMTYTEGKVFPVGGSLAVTLPKSWVEEHNLKVGDTVVKDATSIVLVVSPKGV